MRLDNKIPKSQIGQFHMKTLVIDFSSAVLQPLKAVVDHKYVLKPLEDG